MQYQPTKESVDTHPVPDWYHDAKFGIFIHWSLSCVPAFAPTDKGDIMDILRKEGPAAMMRNQPYSEWYLNSIRIKGTPAYEYHRKTYGEGYDYYNFANDYNEALGTWDPAGWADLFKEVGARYVVLVTKHHDGFLLWPSEHLNPIRPDLHATRDIVGELTDQVKSRGMRMGFYYSSPYDWIFTDKPMVDLATSLARMPRSKQYIDYATGHWHELIDRYDPAVLWSDIGYCSPANINEIFAHFYNKRPDGVVNERWGQMANWLKLVVQVPGVRQYINRKATRLWLAGSTSPPGVHYDFVTPEYTTYSDVREEKWECVRGIGKSFGYNKQEVPEDFTSVKDFVLMLIDIVSKNGNLLLNVGPKPGGEIPHVQVDRIKGIGAWLAGNGEAIYGTRPWKRAEGKTDAGTGVRFTTRGGSLYAIIMEPSGQQEVTIESLRPPDGMQVELLGRQGPIEWKQSSGGIKARLGELPKNAYAVCLKMTPAPS